MGRYVLQGSELQISLLTLSAIFLFLTSIQYCVGIFVSDKLNLKKHDVITGFQLVITIFCVWVSASPAKDIMQLGTGMLIASTVGYVLYTFKRSPST